MRPNKVETAIQCSLCRIWVFLDFLAMVIQLIYVVFDVLLIICMSEACNVLLRFLIIKFVGIMILLVLLLFKLLLLYILLVGWLGFMAYQPLSVI